MSRLTSPACLMLLLWASSALLCKANDWKTIQQLTESYSSITRDLESVKKRLQVQEELLKKKDLHIKELDEKLDKLLKENERNTLLMDERESTLQSYRPMHLSRSCHEMWLAHPSLPSGKYWIDPDGQGVGDHAIHVHCDMVSGSTTVLHDRKHKMDVGSRQMVALAEYSNECHDESNKEPRNHTSSGQQTLARVCSGQVAITGMPRSCKDLWKLGHVLSGIYLVAGKQLVETVYCNFTELPSSIGFQSFIGYAEVASNPLFFSVQRNTSFNNDKIAIPFEITRLNIGGGMNTSSGYFTAPRKGNYFFTFSSLALISTNASYIEVTLYHNDIVIASSYTGGISLASVQLETFSLQAAVSLQIGDNVHLKITRISKSQIQGSAEFDTQFSGWLIQEDLSSRLKVA